MSRVNLESELEVDDSDDLALALESRDLTLNPNLQPTTLNL
jgi:hypothetical protein